jgi:hypothetical protein
MTKGFFVGSSVIMLRRLLGLCHQVGFGEVLVNHLLWLNKTPIQHSDMATKIKKSADPNGN